MGYRSRRRNHERFQQKMNDMDQQDEAQRLSHQQRPERQQIEQERDRQQLAGSSVQKSDCRVKNVEESCKKETADFKSSSSRSSKESPKKYKSMIKSSSPRVDSCSRRNSKRNLNHKKRSEFLSDDYNDEGSEDDSILKKKSNRRKFSSPSSKIPSTLLSSSTRRNRKLAITRESLMRDENDDISSTNSSCTASPPSYVSSPSRLGSFRSKRSTFTSINARNSDDTKRISREKFPSLSQSTTIRPGDPEPSNATTTSETNDKSDSDGSFNILAQFRERQNYQKDKDEIKKSELSDDAHISRINTPRRGDSSSSLSEDDDDDSKDKNENSRFRKMSKSQKMPYKHYDVDNYYEDSDEREVTKIRKSSSFGKKKTLRRDKSSYDFDDEESVLETSDDEMKIPSRQRGKKKPRDTSKVLKCDATDQFFMTATATGTNNPKTASTSFLDDDDDGFMSDSDPLPAPPTQKSATALPTSRRTRVRSSPVDDSTSRRRKERSSPADNDNKLRKKRKKREKSEEEIERGLAFDNDDNEYEKDRGVKLDDLHPNFENPKFGPYEPMKPLSLSNDQYGLVVQVPASLNRFIAPFQKEGVQFMYECLARKTGVILGDEMGCGKTVQVISLLCALFNKTGTRKDFAKIRRRNVLVREHISNLQKLQDQALRMGEVADENIEEWKASLSLSPWHPVMIIVPPTILDTWKNAFETFSHFSVSFYSSKTKMDAIKSVLYGSADILIVPKSAFQDKKHLNELKRIQWKLIVIDEFHNFKNYKAKISEHLRELKLLHQPLILGMTGTPMQNNHTELWNLIDLVEANVFGTKEEFKYNISRPITLGRHKCADSKAKARSEAASTKLRKGLSKIYIKREKKDVLKGQLPEKNEDLILCDLSPLQKEVYRHVVQLPDFDLVKHGSRPCDCGINQNFFRKLLKLKDKAEQLEYMRTNKSKIVKQSKCCKRIPTNPRYGKEGEPSIDQDAAIWRTLDAHCSNEDAANDGCEFCPWCCTLPCLTKLSKLSSHLGLLQAKKTTEAIGSPAYIRYQKEREFAKVALANVVNQLPGGDYDRNDGIMDDHFSLSGKLRVLNVILKKEYDEGGKILLFSHSTQSLDLIQNWLKSRGSFEYRRMDGSTPLSRRQQLTDEFNNTDSIFLFLLSIKATGLGLNLTSANRVIMFDVSWNPSWEIQAQDRAHRIGQTRDVRVVRLISKGTVEEMIYLRQIYKEHLKQDTLEEHDDGNAVAPRVFRGVQGDKYRKGEIFGTENLFRFKEEGSFLHDIYDLSSGNRGNRNSSDFEVHDSGKVSEALLKMTDDKKKKGGEDNDLVVLKAMSGKSLSNNSNSSPGSIRKHEPTTVNEEQANNEQIEKQVRAVNHRDFFRSDRGGAAITSGDDGFAEEMGGQTQAAYEIYENIRDDLLEEDENVEDVVDDDDDDDDSKCKNQGQKDKNDRNQNDSPTLKDESETRKNVNEAEISDQKNPVIASRSILAQTRCDTTNVCGGTFLSSADVNTKEFSNLSDDRRTSKLIFESNIERKLVRKSLPTVHDNCRIKTNMPRNDSTKELHAISTMDNNQTKNKVLLFGYPNIYDVKTEFSAADLRRPVYRKKKKRKKVAVKTTIC